MLGQQIAIGVMRPIPVRVFPRPRRTWTVQLFRIADSRYCPRLRIILMQTMTELGVRVS